MDSEIDLKNFVVVTSVSGEKFAGWLGTYFTNWVNDLISDSEPGMDKNNLHTWFMTSQTAKRLPVVIERARKLLNEEHPQQGPQGQIGLVKFVFLLPIDVAIGPINNLHIQASSWYFPLEHEGLDREFINLLKSAEENELQARARKSGLVHPSEMKTNPISRS